MSFKDSFEAAAQIKASGSKLSAAVERIEALEASLAELREVQTNVAAMLEKAKTSFGVLEAAAAGLSSERMEFQKVASALPIMADDVLAQAEERLIQRQESVAQLVEKLPAMVEALIEQKLATMMSQMENRLADRIRDDLKDTRSTLRDAFEVNARTQETKLGEIKTEIIAEMPRTILGRRGR